MVTDMRRIKKNMSVVVDMKKETVVVMVDGVEAAKAEFTLDDTQIMVTNVGTEEPYQKSGYGRLLFDALKLVSNQKKMPLILWSLDGAIPFYERVGMLHLDDITTQKQVIFGNIKKGDLKEKIDDDDFIYIPKSLKKKPTIYL